MSVNRVRPWILVAASFAVYLIPLVGPHAAWLLGEMLTKELTSTTSRSALWVATDTALAVALQLAVLALLAWSSRASWRMLVWVAVVPATVVGMNTAYLVAIPSYFLIEPDTAPELIAWEEHCFVKAVSLLAVRTSANPSAEGARMWWLQRPDGRYALLRVPDCAVIEPDLPRPTLQPGGRVDFTLGPQFVGPGGAMVLERMVPSTSERSWWLLASPMAMLERIAVPALPEAAPILADQGDDIAWIQHVAGSRPPLLDQVLIRRLGDADAADRVVELSPFGPALYVLLGVDTAARQLLLWRNERPMAVGFDGTPVELAFDPGAMRPQATTYLRHRSGWVAWDAYREEGAYQIGWQLDTGRGTRAANLGRSITAAAVDPSGRFIAVSETTTLNIGDARDVVYVLRTDIGTDVFRRYLPRYARSPVVFLAGGLFAYSDLDGTHVLSLPRR